MAVLAGAAISTQMNATSSPFLTTLSGGKIEVGNEILQTIDSEMLQYVEVLVNQTESFVQGKNPNLLFKNLPGKTQPKIIKPLNCSFTHWESNIKIILEFLGIQSEIS